MNRPAPHDLTFALTPREERCLAGEQDFSDIPFETRMIEGREVPYLPLVGLDAFSTGKSALFTIKRHGRFQAFPEHCHDCIEINYLYRGTCRQVVNGQTIDLVAGQALLLNRDTIHTILPLDEDDILLNLNIDPHYLMTGLISRLSCDTMVTQIMVDSLNDSISHEAYLLFRSEGDERLRTYMENLLAEWEEPSAMARDITNSLLALIVSELMLAYEETCLERSEGPIGAALPILHYLEQHYATCTLEETAEEFHLNPTYLSSLLKEKIGLSYREVVQHLRLDAAEHLLLTSDLSVTEVAHQVGYENVTFFYKKFKARNACSPGEFRERERAKAREAVGSR